MIVTIKIKLFTQKKNHVRSELKSKGYGCRDNKKILEHTDWQIDHTLEQGLQETINWFSDKKNLVQYKAGIYNI